MGKTLKNNKAYSFVEMIVVIGILLVVSAMSLLSFTIIKSARGQDAALVFDSTIAELITRSKNMNSVKERNMRWSVDNSGPYDFETIGYTLKIYWDDEDEVYCLQFGDYYADDKSGGKDPTTGGSLISRRRMSYYGDFKPQSLTGDCVIKFTPEGSTTSVEIDESHPIEIRYTKRGICVDGFGKYEFFRSDGTTHIADVIVRRNGSHIVN